MPLKCDLSAANFDEIRAHLSLARQKLGACSRALIVHNAGTLGALKYLRNLNDPKEFEDHHKLNVWSVVFDILVFKLRYKLGTV